MKSSSPEEKIKQLREENKVRCDINVGHAPLGWFSILEARERESLQ